MRSCVCSPHLVYAAVPASTGLASPSRSSYRIIINSVSLSVPVCIPVCVHPTWSTLLYQCGLYWADFTFQNVIRDTDSVRLSCLSVCLSVCIPVYLYAYLSVFTPPDLHPAVPAWSLSPFSWGGEASKKMEFEIACYGIDCIGEFLTQF